MNVRIINPELRSLVSLLSDERRYHGWWHPVHVLLLLLFAVLPPCVSAQPYTFKVYGREQGLDDPNTICILEDRRGFLWVGTLDGLARYDEGRFRMFGTADGLPSTVITSLHESPDGTLWVGTRGGLVSREGERFQTVGLPKSTGVFGPAAIASDAEGHIYVGTTLGLAVGTMHGGDWQIHPPNLSDKHVDSVSVDPRGAVWLGCGRSLCRLEGGQLVVQSAVGLISDRWGAILTDGDGNLWVRSLSRLLVRLAGTDQFLARDEGLPEASSRALGLDRQGNVMCATNFGLAVRTGDHWRLIGQRQGLPQDTIYSFLQDREGSVWVGGLRRVARWLGYGQWEHWTQVEGLGNEIVRAICRDASGAVWVGTDSGLYCKQPGKATWQSWTTRQHLAGDRILALASGSDGAGSSPSGVTRIDASSGAVRRYGPESGLSGDPAIRLLPDRQGRLWVATTRGLFLGTKTAGGNAF